MGDKGGKKDKDKSNKQKANKQQQALPDLHHQLDSGYET